MSFHYLKEDGTGALLLESFGAYLVEQIFGSARVQAVAAGFYKSDWKDIGDVFDVTNTADFSDSTSAQVPVGNPDYPLFGWMTSVPAATPLYNFALRNGGISTVRQKVRRWVL